MHRYRGADKQATSLAAATVAANGGFAGRFPSLPAISGVPPNPIGRIGSRKVGGLVCVAASIGAVVSLVPFDSGVPGLAVERSAALLACQRNRLHPRWIRRSANVLALKPTGIVSCGRPKSVHALSVFNSKAGARTEPLAPNPAWRHQHYDFAALARQCLALVFCHASSVLGSGTTGQVAQALGRQWVGCELNPEYAPLQRARTAQASLRLETV